MNFFELSPAKCQFLGPKMQSLNCFIIGDQSNSRGSLISGVIYALPQVKTHNMDLDSNFYEFFELSPAKCQFPGPKMESLNRFIIRDQSNIRGSLISGVIHAIFHRKLGKLGRGTVSPGVIQIFSTNTYS